MFSEQCSAMFQVCPLASCVGCACSEVRNVRPLTLKLTVSEQCSAILHKNGRVGQQELRVRFCNGILGCSSSFDRTNT